MAKLQRWTILDNNGNIADFLADNNNNGSFKFTTKIMVQKTSALG